MDCTATQHGTSRAYDKFGCRCETARTASRRVQKIYRRKVELNGGPLWMDPCGTRRRLQALACIGWSLNALAQRLGVTKQAVSQYRDGRLHVTRNTHDRVAALYDELYAVDGPGGSRTVHNAVKAGWAPPWAWSDDAIDDPLSAPQTAPQPSRVVGGRPVVRDALWAADVAWLRSWGIPDRDIAARFGLDPASLRRALQRVSARPPEGDRAEGRAS